MKKYITYGLGNKFDPNKLVTNLKDSGLGKPEYAWWGSPTDAEYGWKEWAEDNDFLPHGYKSYDEYFSPENSITWHLEEGSKVLDLKEVTDLMEWIKNDYITITTSRYERKLINFQKILEDGYVAVELYDACIGHRFINEFEMMFNSWDCESIVVLDPSKIIQD